MVGAKKKDHNRFDRLKSRSGLPNHKGNLSRPHFDFFYFYNKKLRACGNKLIS